jgi:hypothetical protein
MKKAIFTLVLFVFAVAVHAQDKTTAPAKSATMSADNLFAPEIKFEVEEYNFGTIKQGDKVKYDFKFANVGKEPLIISDARGSCGCTVPEWPKEPIAKGAKGSIHIEFDSAGKQGLQDKTVTISSNAKGGQKILHLKGNVEAPTPIATPAKAGTPEKK